MAVLGPWTNAYVVVNLVDISNHVTAGSVETTRDEVDITAMGAVNKVFLPGLGDATMTATVLQDFAVGSIDQTLQALSLTSTPFTVGMRPVNAARSTSNPEYQMTALMYGWTPMSGSLGDALTVDLTFRNAAQTGLVRLTA